MIRICNLYFARRTLILIAVEGSLVCLAFIVATLARFGAQAELQLVQEGGFGKIVLVAFVCMLCMHYYDLYDSFTLSGSSYLFTRILQVLGTSCMAFALLYVVYPSLRLGAGPFCLGLTLALIALVSSRSVFSALSRNRNLTEKAILLGHGALAQSLCSEISSRPEFGLTLAGYVGPDDSASSRLKLQFVGTTDALPAIVGANKISRIIVATEGDVDTRDSRIFADLTAHGVLIQDARHLYEAMTGKLARTSLRPGAGSAAELCEIPLWILIYKRAASIMIASVGLFFALPVIAFAAVAIRLDSPGPVLFRQQRVGKGGKLFTLYKLRTMYRDVDAEGRSKPAHAADSRFTRVGKWLRRTRMDELPQLFNILRGDMHLIGPRPFAADMEMELAGLIPFYEQRWRVKPGATGWAQVRRGYCTTIEDNIEKLSYDIFYIKNISIGLDLMIFLETIKTLLLRRGSV